MLGFLIIFTMVTTYLIWDQVAEKNVVAKRNSDKLTATVEASQPPKKMEKESDQKQNNVENGQKIEHLHSEKDSKQTHSETKKNPIQADKENVIDTKPNVTKKDQKKKDAVDSESKKNNQAINKEDGKAEQLEIGKVVYMTFDDGPHPTASQEILQLLEKYNAKASYFMLEPNMKQNPDVVKAMIQDGHTVGVHGVTHDVSKVYKSPQSFVAEMNTAIDFIAETTNVNTHLVRAPYGSKPYITAPFQQASDQANFIIWDWNVDSVDWKLKNGQYVQEVIQQINHLEGKEPLVILMHEKPTTAAHLENLLKYFQDNGYEMRAINESMQPIQFK